MQFSNHVALKTHDFHSDIYYQSSQYAESLRRYDRAMLRDCDRNILIENETRDIALVIREAR